MFLHILLFEKEKSLKFLNERTYTLTKKEILNSNFGGSFYNDKLSIYIIDYDKDIIPHFHIVDSKTQGNSFETRILLKKIGYYSINESKLTNRQINSLIKHLSKINKRSYPLNLTNWSLIVWYWNRFNKTKVNITKMLNFNKLKD